MRVLIATELFPPDCSGGGWSTYNLAKALDKEDEIDVKVLAVNQEEVKDDLNIEKVTVSRFSNELAYYQIKKEIDKRKDNYDIIQGQHSLTIPPLAWMDDKPTVGVIRDYWPVCFKTTLRDNFGNNHLQCGAKCLFSTFQDFTWKSPYKFLNHYYRQNLAKKVDILAARSCFVEERLKEHGFDNTEVHYNFVKEGFSEGVEPKGKGDILFVGTLSEQKGPQLVVEAIPKILEEKQDLNFVFLGDGEIRGELANRTKELGVEKDVKFKGHVSKEEVKSRMKGAEVVLSPSLWHEPLSRVLLESQALGTPIITTDRGGNSEAVEQDKVFDPEKESLSERILQTLENNKSDVSLHTSEKEVVEKWKNTYQSLIEKET